MKFIECAYSLATENHGVLTAADARKAGISSRELARWVKSGRLAKLGHGVYRATMYPMSEEDPYAIAVAEAGSGACLFGESVVGMLRLMPVNLDRIHVAIPRRFRRRLSPNYVVTVARKGVRARNIHGIMCQEPADAIRECIGAHMPERLVEAAGEAYRTGWIGKEEAEALAREVRGNG